MKKIILITIFVIILLGLTITVIAIPSVSNVRVLPENPNAGQNLLCNYTYSSPENYTEQNSTFEWWKNSINQNINSQILTKENLSIGDNWYCRVTGYDGLNFSSTIQSGNIVTILNATQNPIMYVNGSVQWNESGYYGDSKDVLDFTSKLNNALENCTADGEGFCTILITFSSNNNGMLNSSNLGIYYSESRSSVVSLKIESISTMYSNGTLKIFEFVILNDGSTTVTDIQWRFDTNDSNVINSTLNISSLASNERAFVYIQYNFSSTGRYNVMVNATGISSSNTASSSLSSSIGVGDFTITSFSNLNTDVTKVIFEIQAQNNLENNLTNLNWLITSGDGQTINSTTPFSSIKPNETVFIFVNYDYGKTGTFNPSASVTNGTYTDSKSITLDVIHLQAYNLSLLNQSVNGSIFEFIIKNSLSNNLTNVSWNFDTKNSNVINSTINSTLQSSEQMFVYIAYNFTSTGTFNVNATAKNGTLIDSRNLTINIT